MIAQVVPESPLESTDDGLVPSGEGWFVANARDSRWIRRPGRGFCLPLTGWTNDEVERYFPQLGVNVFVLTAGDTIGIYHRETDQEGFLVVAGEALLLVEGTERPLRPWDYVHCPPGTEHIVVGAGNGRCVIVAVGGREHQAGDWGAYTVDETARRHGVGVDEETRDPAVAYARFPPAQTVRYEEGLLPEL
jgi:quercetin dioxygenase-like cupin family protein